MKRLMLSALLLTPSLASAQGQFTFITGYRGKVGPQHDKFAAAPLLGADWKPIRWKWGALGAEVAWVPRRMIQDSGTYNPPGQGCYGPQGQLTTCAFRRSLDGEGSLQAGLVAEFGPRNRRVAPFAEVALGYYSTNTRNRIDIWDPEGTYLSNLSNDYTDTSDGVYARVGGGVAFKPWQKGPALLAGARYRWARRGFAYDWFEWYNERSGMELVLGVRF